MENNKENKEKIINNNLNKKEKKNNILQISVITITLILVVILICATTIFYNILNTQRNVPSDTLENNMNTQNNTDETDTNIDINSDKDFYTVQSNENDNIGYAQVRYQPLSSVFLNKKLYITYDGQQLKYVPGTFTEQIENNVYDTSYNISKDITVLYCENKSSTKRRCLLTTDCGKKWTISTIPSNGDVKYLNFVDDKNGFLVIYNQYAGNTAEAQIYSTSNSGENWNLVSTQDFSKNSRITFLTPKDGSVVTRSDYEIARAETSDGGKTFIVTRIPLTYQE